MASTARAFEDYVVSITGSASAKTGGFISESQFASKVSLNSSSATVSFNENNQKYYIGPFTLTYPSSQFCYITSVTLTADVNTNTRTYKVGNNWNFYDISGTFPSSGAPFYIALNYIEGMSEIQGLQFDFCYTDASGSYTNYNGQYYEYTYTLRHNEIPAYYAQLCYDIYTESGGKDDPIASGEYGKNSTYEELYFMYDGQANEYYSNVSNGGRGGVKYPYETSYVYDSFDIGADFDEEAYYIYWYYESIPTNLYDYYLTLDWVDPHSQNLCEVNSGDCWITTNNPASKSINLSIDLTMKMGGTVWKDADKDGIIGKNSESGIEGVKVTLYRVKADGSKYNRDALVFDENNRTIDSYTYTDSKGNWSFDRVSVPAFNPADVTGSVKAEPIYYSVGFEYDGQTYEPTQVVNSAYKTDRANKRQSYASNSMAQDLESTREEFNESFTYIEGNNAIDASTGKTSGVAYDKSRKYSKTLNYSSKDSLSNYDTGNSRKVSTLDTKGSNEVPYDQYKIEARSQYANLILYPLDSRFHINKNDKDIGSNTYYAVYDYVNHINFGLTERTTADISVEKDLTEITTVVNEKVMKYEYDAALGIDPDSKISDIMQKQLAVMDADITYTLNVYRSDYYYRASIYGDSTKENNTVATALDKFYTSIGFDAETYYSYKDNRYSYEENRYGAGSTELEIYLTYTIRVHNEKEDTEYDVRINNLTDYYDSTLTLINNDAEAKIYSNVYVQTLNGEEVNDVVTLTKGPEITFYYADGKKKSNNTFSWDKPSNGIVEGETLDGVYFTVAETDIVSIDPKGKDNNYDMKLSAGEYAELVTTYKVDKSTADNGVTNAIELGAKQNVAEVQSYTTYYSKDNTCIWADEGEIAGRVDGDSAPGNVNPDYLYDESLYEDDSDATPTLNIQLTEDPNRR